MELTQNDYLITIPIYKRQNTAYDENRSQQKASTMRSLLFNTLLAGLLFWLLIAGISN
ncbi:hypothetical protein [Ferribacterium limneticum]|uniref:hypothetical protein n=1 Tax=Ferribacterium limneticum TaxID=76259 RepID=UPI001CF9D819|nr:hypothetical protein [Ferribacterium limneticum]UCV20050.1 hypothetical protein KI610_05615 [Ferribacterium limneticum]